MRRLQAIGMRESVAGRALWLALGGLGSLMLGSCSLMGLDAFELPRCVSDAQCSEALRDPAEHALCITHRCVEGSCEPIDAEVWDGLDNDCDYLVDEPDAQDGEAVIRPAMAIAIAGAGTEIAELAVGDDALSTSAVWFDRAGSPSASAAVLGSEASLVPITMRYAANDDASGVPPGLPTESARSAALAMDRCRERASGFGGGESRTLGRCSFAEADLDRFGDGALMATVSTQGCADGQVRVGHVEAQELDAFIVRGPLQRSNSYLGLDLGAEGECSGAGAAQCDAATATWRDAAAPAGAGTCLSEADCSGGLRCVGARGGAIRGYCAPLSCAADAECLDAALVCRCGQCQTQLDADREAACGALDVSVIALDGASPPQGLVSTVGGSHRSRCQGLARPVRVAGLYVEERVALTSFRWVSATDEGHSQTVGETLGVGAPALLSLPPRAATDPAPRGALLGHGDLSGGVALHFIPSLASPPRLSGTECNSAEPTHSIAGASAAGCCPAGAEGCTQTLRCDTSNCTSCVSGGAPRLECVPGDGVCPPDARFCCAPRLTCTVPSAESSLAECSDGCDNDGDGAVDCADSGCAPTACASPCSTLASTCADYSPAEIRECAQTPSLPGPTSLGSLPGLGGIVDEVVLSLGDASETELSLGIAWLETSGASTIVAFRQVLLGLDAGGQPSEILEAGAPVQVSIEARVPSRPALLHVDTGMLESGLERGASIVDPAGRGGWYVVWSQRLVDLSFEVVGRRVSEHDGRPVDADCSGGSCAELLVLSQPTPDNTVDARLPRLFDEGGAPYLLYFDRDAQALVGGFLQAPSP